MSNKNFFFHNFKLNLEQTHETTSQLYHTFNDFKIENNGFFTKDENYRNHIIGKLKFFIDLYADMSNQLHINETVVLDNYYTMLQLLAQDYTDDDLSDVSNDYLEFLIDEIESTLDTIDDNMITDIDEVTNFIGSAKHLNFQEHQFILDCYLATLQDYKIMRLVDGKYQDEVDYYGTRKTIAVNDYCQQFNCSVNDLLIKVIR